jgi:hypothetical protein
MTLLAEDRQIQYTPFPVQNAKDEDTGRSNSESGFPVVKDKHKLLLLGNQALRELRK